MVRFLIPNEHELMVRNLKNVDRDLGGAEVSSNSKNS